MAVLALRNTVQLGLGRVIDGYWAPNLGMRYGISYISELLGYQRRHYLQVISRGGKKLKALQDKGFTGNKLEVKVARDGRGATRSQTLSFDDFCIAVEYEAIELQNPKAIGLLTASFREVLRSRTLAAFDIEDDCLEFKQAEFSRAVDERLRLIADTQEELKSMRLPGDDFYYPEYHDWTYGGSRIEELAEIYASLN